MQPILRLAGNMEAFSRAPENASLIIEPSKRTDEIGTAERELQHMQQELRSMLNQKNHLAALGPRGQQDQPRPAQHAGERAAAVRPADDGEGAVGAKLRAQADRLARSRDRAVQRHPALRPGGRRPSRAGPFSALADLVEEVGDGLGLPREALAYRSRSTAGSSIDADRDQLYRVLEQPRPQCRAGDRAAAGGFSSEIAISARREGRQVVCEVRDTGPGVPEKARANLFRAFQGGARKGGTGLGLAIAAELIAAHGGRLELAPSETGAVFRLVVPDRHSQA